MNELIYSSDFEYGFFPVIITLAFGMLMLGFIFASLEASGVFKKLKLKIDSWIFWLKFYNEAYTKGGLI